MQIVDEEDRRRTSGEEIRAVGRDGWADSFLMLEEKEKEMVHKFGMHNRRAAKLGAVQVEAMRREYANGMTQRELGAKYGVSVGQVGRIVRGESWADTGAARGFVAEQAWEGAEGLDSPRFGGDEEVIAASLRAVQARVSTENPFAQEDCKPDPKVSEDVLRQMRELLGIGS